MTGKEWGEFADRLSGDTPLRKWLMEKLKKEGKTDAQATDMISQMALLARMQSLPPSQWTDEMKALDAKLDADPELRHDLETHLKEAHKAESALKLDGADIKKTTGIEKTGTELSAENRADALAVAPGLPTTAAPKKPTSYASSLDEPAIASPMALVDEYKAALDAKEPLDAPKQVAAFTPPPTPAPTSPGGGFDA